MTNTLIDNSVLIFFQTFIVVLAGWTDCKDRTEVATRILSTKLKRVSLVFPIPKLSFFAYGSKEFRNGGDEISNE
jgi:hypothetical protein